MKKAVLLAAILAGAILNPSFARAGTATITVVDGTTAYADFQFFDDAGCVLTTTHIIGSLETDSSYPPGQTATVKGASIDVTQYDTCTGVLIMQVTGSESTVQFSRSPDLRSARLQASIVGYEAQTSSNIPIDVNMEWHATGKLTHDETHTVYQDGNCRTDELLADFLRDAVASGTVTTEWTGTTNCSPGQSFEAQIQRSIDTTVTKCK